MNGKLELKLNGNKVTVMGGPYLDKPEGIRGVKLAQEIDAPADIILNVPDFGVPTLASLNTPIYEALEVLEQDGVIYVGCMGGIGRTGMFMALLVKTLGTMEYNRARASLWGRIKMYFGKFPATLEIAKRISRPVEYVRENYLGHAVETSQQMRLISDFSADDLLRDRYAYQSKI